MPVGIRPAHSQIITSSWRCRRSAVGRARPSRNCRLRRRPPAS